MPIITKIFGPPKIKNLTAEQKRILQLVSNNNKIQYETLLYNTPQEIEKIIKGYYEEKPILDDLAANGIQVNTLYYLLLETFDENQYKKAVPILVTWLQKKDLSISTKTEIVKVLKKDIYSKSQAFNVILDQFHTLPDEELIKKGGFYNLYSITLYNAIKDWMDDEHANTLFKLLEEKKHSDNTFLIAALLKLKTQNNKEIAKNIAMKELKKPYHTNNALSMYLYVLQKLQALEAIPLVEKYLDFPNHYQRTIVNNNNDDFNPVEDKHVRKSAQKTLEALKKVHE